MERTLSKWIARRWKRGRACSQDWPHVKWRCGTKEAIEYGVQWTKLAGTDGCTSTRFAEGCLTGLGLPVEGYEARDERDAITSCSIWLRPGGTVVQAVGPEVLQSAINASGGCVLILRSMDGMFPANDVSGWNFNSGLQFALLEQSTSSPICYCSSFSLSSFCFFFASILWLSLNRIFLARTSMLRKARRQTITP